MKNEKIISREKIESKIREIYKEAREWCDSGYNRCCDIMIDNAIQKLQKAGWTVTE